MISSVKIDVIPPEGKRHEILNSIRSYRHVCRQLFSASTLAEIAGGKIGFTEKNGEKILNIAPNNEAARDILKNAFGGKHSNHLYELRDFVRTDIAPNFLSFVWDSARRDISSRWLSRDPEFKASRGWLTVQGARGIGFFNHIGIGFPQATAKPKLHEHFITLKWDNILGGIDFQIPKLDGGRYIIFKSLKEEKEGWKPGTVYLNERDGKIFIIQSFERPDPKIDLVKERILTVTINADEPEYYITATVQDKRFTAEKISIVNTLNWLDSIDIVKGKFEKQLAATGHTKDKFRSVIVKKINTMTNKRKEGEKSFSHLWTRRIIEHAVRTQSGKIVISGGIPDNLKGHPWGWYQFKEFLKYKARNINAELIIMGAEKKK